MKNALLFFGQPRYVREAFPNIHRNLIQPNNPDIFIHMWNDLPKDEPFRAGEGWKNERLTNNPIETVIDLYQPKAILVEKQRSFPNDGVDFTNTLAKGYAGGTERPEIAKSHIFSTYSMWYSISKVFDLIRRERYDSVILTRLDLSINRPVKIDSYDLEAIWGESINRPELLLNWMNFGNQNYMNVIFGDMFHIINDLYKESDIWCNEYWCRYCCKKWSIPVKEGYWGLGIPSRNL